MPFRVSVAGKHSWYNCIEEIFSGNTSDSTVCEKRHEPIEETREFFEYAAHQLEDFIYKLVVSLACYAIWMMLSKIQMFENFLC